MIALNVLIPTREDSSLHVKYEETLAELQKLNVSVYRNSSRETAQLLEKSHPEAVVGILYVLYVEKTAYASPADMIESNLLAFLSSFEGNTTKEKIACIVESDHLDLDID